MKRIVRNLFGAVVLLSSATNAFSQTSSINVVSWEKKFGDSLMR